MVRDVAQSLSEDELDELLAGIPLQEQRDKRATVVSRSFNAKRPAVSAWPAGHSWSLADVNSYSTVAGVPRMFPGTMGAARTPRAWAWLERVNARPAVKAALAMENRAPEVLRAFGG